jgi:hypothetical protein
MASRAGAVITSMDLVDRSRTGENQAMAGKGGKRSTSWQPGQSGNLAGRPRVIADVRELARQHTQEAVGVLKRIMYDPKAAAAARVSAANAILDRGWGKPRQPIDASVETMSPEVVKQREETRARAIALMEEMKHQLIAGLPKQEVFPPAKANGHGPAGHG